MSRFISAVMAVVLIMVSLLVGALSCTPISLIGVFGSFLTGLPTTALCYPLFPAIVGTVATIVLNVLGVVAVGATILG